MSAIFSGILLLLLTGIFQGSFAVVYKLYPVRFLYFWFVFAIIGLFLVPVLLVLFLFPAWQSVVFSVPTVDIVLPVVFGVLWGIGLLCFGKSISINGLSSTYAISVGMSTLLGVVFPLIFYKLVIPLRIIALLMIAILLLLIGISMAATVLLSRSKYKRGLFIALFSALFSPCLSVAFYFANPIVVTAQQFHASPFIASMVAWAVILFAACMFTIVYLSFRLGSASFSRDLKIEKRRMLATGIFSGAVWYAGFILYETGPEKLGEIGNAFGWVIMTALSIVVATWWGIRLGELRNKQVFRSHLISLLFLFIGMGILGLTLFLKK